MANTRPDITLVNTAFVDVYALSGITIGTAILIQNKSSGGVYIQIKGFQPASSSTDGTFLSSYEFGVVSSGESGCWVKGSGKMSVQEMS